jgi:nicotinate-nucleotide pyrophosphorylase (carboxylating)
MEESNLQPGQNLAHLLPPSWKADVQRWYAEDTPSFDWAGFVVGEEEQEAILWGKSGVGLAYMVDPELMIRVFLRVYHSSMRSLLMLAARRFTMWWELINRVEWLMPEGSVVPPNTKTKVAIVRGKARQLLLGERVALNTLARCSGIASVYVHPRSVGSD